MLFIGYFHKIEPLVSSNVINSPTKLVANISRRLSPLILLIIISPEEKGLI